MDSEVIALNVGGTHHLMTERDVLRAVPGSTLEKMFNGMHELKMINEEVFLDRDGNTFGHLINYLRNKRDVFPEFTDPNEEIHFFKELEWWKIATKQAVSRRTAQVSVGQSLQPARIPESVKETLYKSEAPPVVKHTRMQSPPSTRTMPTQPQHSHQPDPFSDARSDDSHGVALKAAKDKWNELGPLRLEDIMRNSSEPIDQTRTFGQSHYNKYILG